MPDTKKDKLVRELKNRHVQMIAFGGALGAGLYYGSAEAISLAGPAVMLSYLIGGVVIYFIMRMLGEMSVQEPVSGSFSYFAYKYWGNFSGFFSGWNYWFLYILVTVAELTAVAIYLDHWIMIPHWQAALLVLCLMTIVNLVSVRFFGEFEFWLALIKVIAVVAMILFGGILIVGNFSNETTKISNLWEFGGFFPYGVGGMMMALIIVMFSFGGIELFGIAAAETKQPEKTIPRAINQIMGRILLFYIGAIGIIMILIPWTNVGQSGSPFVTIFDQIGIPAAGHIFNLVVINAAISVCNSGIYSNGRMLYSLAEQNSAPKILQRLNRFHSPYMAILFSSFCVSIALIINYMIAEGAFMRIMALVTAAVIITWLMIVLVNYKFRKQSEREQIKLVYQTPFYPLPHFFCFLFLLFLLFLMFLSGFTEQGNLTRLLTWLGYFAPDKAALITQNLPDMSVSLAIIPLWIVFLYLGYRFSRRFQQENAIKPRNNRKIKPSKGK